MNKDVQKPVSDRELFEVSSDELTKEERRLDVEIKRLELAERQEKQAARLQKKDERLAEWKAKQKSILIELAQRRARQNGCSHRKGGLGDSVRGLPIEGGDADSYALLKHQLPSGDWYILCQRCGAEWTPADRFTGKPATGFIGELDYKGALRARTDNSPSKSCVFKFEDFRTPEQVAADKWQPPRNEDGSLVNEPAASRNEMEPSAPVRATR